MITKGQECPKCHNDNMEKNNLPSGYWLECPNCGFIPTEG